MVVFLKRGLSKKCVLESGLFYEEACHNKVAFLERNIL
jgi:hypothetical protein